MDRARDGRVVVIGAGVAGLSAALLLARSGRAVTVLERAGHTGGKARRLPSPAGEIDAGPTVFTMRGVFDELFAAAGARLDDRVALRPLDVLARHYWPDGATLDLLADMEASRERIAAFAGPRAAAEFAAFDARARVLFDAFEAPVMRNPRPTPFGVAGTVAGQALAVLRALGARPTLAGALERQFSDPRLAQLFGRYATYVGGSPYLSPAVLMLIWRAEAAGVWRIDGGVAALAGAIAALAEEAGAQIRTGAEATEIEVAEGRATGARLADGERVAAATVLFNGDPAALEAGLLGAAVRPAAAPTPRAARSLSAWVWTFAGAPEGAPLAYHTVFFGADYRREFDALFRDRATPDDPTLYICAQDRAPGRIPGRPERLMMIMNAPADGDLGAPDDREVERCTTRVFGRLRASGLRLDPPGREAITTPADFAAMFPGTGGALYGAAPHGMMATFRRPTARTRVPGLYLAGGAGHPGPGVAMSCLSGQLAAAAIMQDRGST